MNNDERKKRMQKAPDGEWNIVSVVTNPLDVLNKVYNGDMARLGDAEMNAAREWSAEPHFQSLQILFG